MTLWAICLAGSVYAVEIGSTLLLFEGPSTEMMICRTR